MTTSDADLSGLRREIDAIDDRIHDLLMQRTEIVEQIGVQKQQAGTARVGVRPGREAEIIRRLLKRHKGAFPRPVIVRLWRELLSAQVRVQGQFALAVCTPKDATWYRDLASDHFGAYTPMSLHESPSQVLKAVSDGLATVGVLPIPDGENDDPWWRNLMSAAEGVPKIVARLPFAEMGIGEGRHAFVVAPVAPESTQDDVTLLAFETTGSTSRGRLKELFEGADLDATWIAATKMGGGSEGWQHLVSVPEFIREDDLRLDSVLRAAVDRITRIIPIGVYAKPLSKEDIGLAD
ncbi:MAG: chorismate mutase [Rhodospirillaceae bacterium]|nr:chorismate mutase [Rhodospirillaceae bacterium]|tara:strand:+ start:379 stop:1257 length:879 start_codon:yes stop_codon:yes gene_type:complete